MKTDTLPLINTGLTVNFGTSGWRGQIGQDFIPDNIKRVVQGIALYHINDVKKGSILIGFDPRQDNHIHAKTTASILAGNGIDVKIIADEPTPTPVLAFLASTNEDITGVINFTASHNPAVDDGIKFSPYHGGAANKAITDAIAQYANNATDYKCIDFNEAVANNLITVVDHNDVIAEYIDNYLIANLKKNGAWSDICSYITKKDDFSLVVDAMQGTGAKYLQYMLEKMSVETGKDFYTILHTDNTDPQFSKVGNAPNPTLASSTKDLISAVKTNSTTLGLAVDGDSDRFGIVDFDGIPLSSNEILALLAFFFKEELNLNGAVGKTVATTNFVNAVAAFCNLELTETAVGYKWFVEETIYNNKQFIIAGEESAHVGATPFEHSWDDGIAIAFLTFWIVAKKDISISTYKEMIEEKIGKKFFIETNTFRGKDNSVKDFVNSLIAETVKELANNTPVAETQIADALSKEYNQKVVDIITLDGVKVVFDSGDWVLLRPSGTEPAVKIYVEVTNKDRYPVLLGIAKTIARI